MKSGVYNCSDTVEVCYSLRVRKQGDGGDDEVIIRQTIAVITELTGVCLWEIEGF